MMIAEQKLKLIQQIVSLPDGLLQDLQTYVDGLVAKKKAKKQNIKAPKEQSYEERLKELYELAAKIPERENWEEFISEFDESRKDRPLPFRED